MIDGWLKGNKDIMRFLGINDVKVLRKWRYSYGLPVRHLPSGRSVALPAELTRWLIEYDKLRKAHPKTPLRFTIQSPIESLSDAL